MAQCVYNVLLLCTGNSARSMLAEAILNREGRGRFQAYGAGSFPKGQVHRGAIHVLDNLGYDTNGFHSKSWDEFAGADAPAIDFVFTVCDYAAGEVCPIWPDHPMTAHWGIPDPAAVDESNAEVHAAFFDAYRQREHRQDEPSAEDRPDRQARGWGGECRPSAVGHLHGRGSA